jgi:hypothetical protein
MNRIAREADTVLDLEGRRTRALNSSDILTAARLIVRDGKDSSYGSTTMLEMNFVRYASFKYNTYKEYDRGERETVPKAAAQQPPPPLFPRDGGEISSNSDEAASHPPHHICSGIFHTC